MDDTMEIRMPRPNLLRRLARGFADRWEDSWPPLVGCILGISGGTALVLLAVLWWLNA